MLIPKDSLTAEEVLSSALEVVRDISNEIVNGVDTIKDHPTYLTKTMIRNESHRLQGAVRVFHKLSFAVGQEHEGPLWAEVERYQTRATEPLVELPALPTGVRAR